MRRGLHGGHVVGLVVRSMKRIAFTTTLLCGIALAACQPAARTPQQTVGLYLSCLKGKDPMRALSLLAPEYHLEHGLLFTNTADLPDGIVLPPLPSGKHFDRAFAIERGRLGWLFAPAQMGRAHQLFPELSQIQLAWLGEQVSGDRAAVGLRAWVTDEASVDFRFRLEREDAESPWKIRGIDAQSDGSWKARLVEYVIAPSYEGVEVIRREVERAIREDEAGADPP